MKIAHIRISNILGIDDLEFSPDAGFTEITGPNGAGKTSVLESIKAALQAGHDATLLRKGAKEGEIVLVLDDGREIHRKVTEKGSKTDLVQDGKKMPRPAEAIKALTDMLSVNPVDFLRAPKKDRVKVLLEAMPLEADANELSQIAGAPVAVEPGTHALDAIENVYKRVFDERTGTNRAVREKSATIKQLSEAIPEVPGGVDGNENDLQAQVDTARAAKDSELERITKKLEGIREQTRNTIDEIRDELIKQIDKLKAEAQTKVDKLQAELADLEGKAGLQRERTIQKFNDTVTPIMNTMTAIRANRDVASKREQQIKIIEQMRDELEELRTEADRQTQALAAIEKYKSDLLSSLPIPGLEVVDGEIMRDGVPFDRLNTAQQVDIAVELAKLRAGTLGVIAVDGIELLDNESYEAFRERAQESGLQLFVSRVSPDGEFTINAGAS